MAKRNLTVHLDEEVVRKAKMVAARRCTSVSRLVTEHIERLATEDDDYEAAMRRALALMDTGLDLGGPPYPARDQLHERHGG